MEKKMKKSNAKTKEGKIIPFVNRCDVLIVEDEPSFVVLIGEMIRSRFPNLRIQSAEDGIEGLKKVKAFKPCIVWTGVKMPRMDGLEMIELIRQDPDLKNTKILVCTGCYTMKDVKSRVLELRVDRFFPKPFDIEEALSAIAACLP
jgi:CheY-like chemotaxis protein